MRPGTIVLILLSIVTAFVAATCIAILQNLEGAEMAVFIDPLVHGDLWPLLSSDFFWSTFPAWPAGSAWFPGPAMAVAGFGAVLWMLARSRPHWSPTWFAAGALSFAVPLWGVGRLALFANDDPATCGPWIAWMVAGPLYASALASACLAAGWWRAARPRDSKDVTAQLA